MAAEASVRDLPYHRKRKAPAWLDGTDHESYTLDGKIKAGIVRVSLAAIPPNPVCDKCHGVHTPKFRANKKPFPFGCAVGMCFVKDFCSKLCRDAHESEHGTRSIARCEGHHHTRQSVHWFQYVGLPNSVRTGGSYGLCRDCLVVRRDAGHLNRCRCCECTVQPGHNLIEGRFCKLCVSAIEPLGGCLKWPAQPCSCIRCVADRFDQACKDKPT
jgi:hypothetical protein